MTGAEKDAGPHPDQPIKYVAARMTRGEVPKGAVIMTRNDILKLQYARIKRWKPDSDKSFFQYSHHIVGATSAITAILVNTHFRNKFYLGSYGVAFSYVPTVVIPTLLSFIANDHLIGQVLERPECHECLEVRSGVMQVAISVFYSCFMAPISSIFLSRKYHTYLIKNNFQPDVKHALKTKPFARFCFIGLIALNFSVGAFVRHKQGTQLQYIMENEPYHVTKELLEKIRD